MSQSLPFGDPNKGAATDLQCWRAARAVPRALGVRVPRRHLAAYVNPLDVPCPWITKRTLQGKYYFINERPPRSAETSSRRCGPPVRSGARPHILHLTRCCTRCCLQILLQYGFAGLMSVMLYYMAPDDVQAGVY